MQIIAISSIALDIFPRLGCVFAAIKLHYALLNGISHAPISFFDQTPSGRILSRFSKDIDVLDTTMPELISDLAYCFFEVIFHQKNKQNQQQKNNSKA